MASKKAPADTDVDPFAQGEKAVPDGPPPTGTKKPDDTGADFWKNIKNKTKKRISASSSKERSMKTMKKFGRKIPATKQQ